MLVRNLNESVIEDIGHAFGYYDYGNESGMVSAYSGPEAVSEYICGYVRGVLRGGFLHTTSERGEGYIAYLLTGERAGLRTFRPIMLGLLRSMSPRELLRFAAAMKEAGPGLSDRMKKEKRAHIFVGLVCVREKYQGQGHMRRVMELAFREGERLGVPVVLETDARSKCDKYIHLGMELAGMRRFGAYGKLYDLVKYPPAGDAERGSAR